MVIQRKIIVTYLVKKLPTFYLRRRPVTVFITAHRFTLS